MQNAYFLSVINKTKQKTITFKMKNTKKKLNGQS